MFYSFLLIKAYMAFGHLLLLRATYKLLIIIGPEKPSVNFKTLRKLSPVTTKLKNKMIVGYISS